MPGRTPYGAFSAFVEPLANALSCVAVAKIQPSPKGKTEQGPVHTLFLTGIRNDGHVRLGGPTRLEFQARIFYKIVEDDRDGYGPYKISTRGYDYAICTSDRVEILNFHWHPSAQSHETRPHMHIGSTQLSSDSVLTNKQHIRTGRITFESTIREAIEFGAEPLHNDWAARLDACESPHLAFRSWSVDYERETGRKISS